MSLYDAKTQLSKLVDQSASGEDVIIAPSGKPVVRPTQLEPAARRIRFGLPEGKVRVAADSDAPLPEALLAQFEGR